MSMNYSGRVDIEHVLNGSYLEGLVRRRTNEIASRARSLAPRRTGRLATSITTQTRKNSGQRNDRVVGYVTATAPHSSAIEFGTSDGRPFFFLRRAAQS